MFKPKKCPSCTKSIKDSFDFCPYCGKSLDNKNTWGMLGKNDAEIKQEQGPNSLLGGMGGGMLNKIGF